MNDPMSFLCHNFTISREHLEILSSHLLVHLFIAPFFCEKEQITFWVGLL